MIAQCSACNCLAHSAHKSKRSHLIYHSHITDEEASAKRLFIQGLIANKWWSWYFSVSPKMCRIWLIVSQLFSFQEC